jgi:uncharacterized protein YjbI with pentapeptide repeats
MANPEHLAILKKGVEEWNRWRKRNPDIEPDLSGADLRGENFHDPAVFDKNTINAALLRAVFSNADFSKTNLNGANLSGAEIIRANIASADLSNACLDWTILSFSTIVRANLNHSDMNTAYLIGTDFTASNLSHVEFKNAALFDTKFNHTNLDGVDFEKAIISDTVFADVDIGKVKNLDKCQFHGPSIVDYQTLLKSWPLPIEFLRGVGLPDDYIEFLRSSLGKAIQFYTCFISYSRKDEEFADRLYADLQNKGVRCWQDKKDMPIGARTRPTIDYEIRSREKVIVVLSENSIDSVWIEDEVETVFEEERRTGKDILMPIRIDNAVMETDKAWAAKLRRQRNIGDFTGWIDHDKYEKAFDILLKWLKYEKTD